MPAVLSKSCLSWLLASVAVAFLGAACSGASPQSATSQESVDTAVRATVIAVRVEATLQATTPQFTALPATAPPAPTSTAAAELGGPSPEYVARAFVESWLSNNYAAFRSSIGPLLPPDEPAFQGLLNLTPVEQQNFFKAIADCRSVRYEYRRIPFSSSIAPLDAPDVEAWTYISSAFDRPCIKTVQGDHHSIIVVGSHPINGRWYLRLYSTFSND